MLGTNTAPSALAGHSGSANEERPVGGGVLQKRRYRTANILLVAGQAARRDAAGGADEGRYDGALRRPGRVARRGKNFDRLSPQQPRTPPLEFKRNAITVSPSDMVKPL